ncbi:D-alanyl-D-alanine carboxypeptidase/D-alanyl-D-alanine endopeptidase [Ornithinibacillus contaminans]|uniref:D-alanyl-D-alanine carboxypeptidase/D-alanyl-D-alanine endopeptidase n=1 Tax=Ornithinibacillus contaminans TaxID=694055 RepID=UPI001F00DECF|nr:D-alanyl-D-alanine carboxypeptidase/D-alanyl-D-alanine-endopeptidase [Ornithinibacillus contaminans]
MEDIWRRFEILLKEEPKLNGALAGISIRSRKTGELIYEHLGDIRLHPASNMKLLTCAVALSVLGKDYTFQTELWMDGEIVNQKLIGNLLLKGKGDPTLLPDQFDQFARKIRELGINEITGNIIGDDSWYDGIRLSKDLNWSDETYYYGAQVSALTASPNEDFDSGSIILDISPGEAVQEKPIVKITPSTNYVQVINQAITIHSIMVEQPEELQINRIHGQNLIQIEGSIPINAEDVREWVAVWEPTNYALDLFYQSLVKHGVEHAGIITTGLTPKAATLLHTHYSIPLAELCHPFMKLSNNGHGEILVKELGKKIKGIGSWEAGLEVLDVQLREMGMDTAKLVIRDGSGISHVNLIPPNELSNFLYLIQENEWFPIFYQSLPEAGSTDRLVGGTLRDRLIGYSVQAKTGTIMGVSTLSGYLTTTLGEDLIFSVMLNNLLDEEEGPAIIDRLLTFIIEEKK